MYNDDHEVGDTVIYTIRRHDYLAEYVGAIDDHPHGVKIVESPEGAPKRDGEMVPLHHLLDVREARLKDLLAPAPSPTNRERGIA